MPVKISRDLLLKATSVILRVPALFIAEVWYRTDPVQVHQHFHPRNSKFVMENIPKDHEHLVKDLEKTHEILMRTVYYIAIMLAFALLMLPLKKLVNVYMYILSAGLLVGAHFLSLIYVEEEEKYGPTHVLEDHACLQRLAVSILLQCTIASIIGYLLDLKHFSGKAVLLIYSLPMIARLTGYPSNELHKIHNLAFIFVVMLVTFVIFNKIPLVLDFAKTALQKTSLAIQLYGWIPFLVAMWLKVLLPVQFLIFWLVLFALQIFKYFSMHNHPIFNEGWLVVLLASIAECCVTPVSMMGLCITVSYISFIILTFTKFFLKGREGFVSDNVMHQGWTEGFTMFLLAMQTGLIELKASHRAFLMSIVLFIVLSSLIQSMYEITEPIMLALGASQSRHYWRHVRSILLCTFLWMFPLYMTRLICHFFDVDFWLMVVISSCILTSVQVVGTLVIYTLFIYDSLRSTPWESLDDVVYYAKAFTRVTEFIVAVFVVLYGLKESLVGDWSWFNSSILIIHCYFNVWQRLQAGWKSYLLRREAVKRIESMPEATAEQLQQLNDICAICIQDLKDNVRITPCRHFFHAVCLRKWLYVQEKCPMCHQKIDAGETVQEREATHNANARSSSRDTSVQSEETRSTQRGSRNTASNLLHDESGASGSSASTSFQHQNSSFHQHVGQAEDNSMQNRQ